MFVAFVLMAAMLVAVVFTLAMLVATVVTSAMSLATMTMFRLGSCGLAVECYLRSSLVQSSGVRIREELAC